jgi:hypothetical protein
MLPQNLLYNWMRSMINCKKLGVPMPLRGELFGLRMTMRKLSTVLGVGISLAVSGAFGQSSLQTGLVVDNFANAIIAEEQAEATWLLSQLLLPANWAAPTSTYILDASVYVVSPTIETIAICGSSNPCNTTLWNGTMSWVSKAETAIGGPVGAPEPPTMTELALNVGGLAGLIFFLRRRTFQRPPKLLPQLGL